MSPMWVKPEDQEEMDEPNEMLKRKISEIFQPIFKALSEASSAWAKHMGDGALYSKLLGGVLSTHLIDIAKANGMTEDTLLKEFQQELKNSEVEMKIVNNPGFVEGPETKQ